MAIFGLPSRSQIPDTVGADRDLRQGVAVPEGVEEQTATLISHVVALGHVTRRPSALPSGPQAPWDARTSYHTREDLS